MTSEYIFQTFQEMNRLHFVREVQPSYRPDIEMNFAEKICTKAAFQVQDEPDYENEAESPVIQLAEEV